MNPKAMEPFGKALLAYADGDATAELVICREDGQEATLPVSYFFRDRAAFTPLDVLAIDRCVGRVLDVGAGTGLHSVVLQGKGMAVTAIDINPQAVNIMRQRGLVDVHCTDIFEFDGQGFDTLLMMGHGVGVVETLEGLDRLLSRARDLLSDRGRLLLDSLDVRASSNPGDQAYQATIRRAGRYRGEICMHFEFRGEVGPPCGWLHVDAETLASHGIRAGWHCDVLLQETSGDYLAQLTRLEQERLRA